MRKTLKIYIAATALLLLITFGGMLQESSAALIDGGFELEWTTIPGGNVSIVSDYTFIGDPAVSVSPFAGDYMVLLGSETAPANFNIYNQIIQTDPESYVAPVLNFAYNFWSYDYAPNDDPGFVVVVNGQTVMTLGADDVDDDGMAGALDMTGWQYVSIDLTPFLNGAHENITYSFFAGDTGGNTNLRSGVFLDDIVITNVPVPASMLLFITGLLPLIQVRKQNS